MAQQVFWFISEEPTSSKNFGCVAGTLAAYLTWASKPSEIIFFLGANYKRLVCSDGEMSKKEASSVQIEGGEEEEKAPTSLQM